MFTGLVQAMGVVESSEATAAGRRLLVNLGEWEHRPARGESISVSGCCLSVVETRTSAGAGVTAGFDVIPETLDMTTLGRFRPGRRVNLEHAATPETLLGGHVVQGHVDGVGSVDRIVRRGEYRLRVAPPTGGAGGAGGASLMEFITPKGSITIDGVSLTIADVDAGSGWFEVALIPATLAQTTLGSLREGDPVNIETDIQARTVVHWLRCFGPGRT